MIKALVIITIHNLISHTITSILLSRRGELMEKSGCCWLQPVHVGGGQAGSADGVLQLPPQVCKVVVKNLLAPGGGDIIYKELAKKKEERPMTQPAFRQRLIESLSEPIHSSTSPSARPGPRASSHLEHLQPVRHFPQKGRRRRDCVVCSDRQGGKRHLTHHCPASVDTCFKAYHTQRRYRS